MSLKDYLDLLDWTGRQTISGKRGAIPEHLAPILDRLDIPESGWLELATGFSRVFRRVAGCPASVAREAQRCRNRRRFNLPAADCSGEYYRLDGRLTVVLAITVARPLNRSSKIL